MCPQPSILAASSSSLRDGEEELPEQEGPERGERPRQDQGLVGVDPAEPLHDQEHRDDDDFLGHDERAEVEHEQPAPEPEVQAVRTRTRTSRTPPT